MRNVLQEHRPLMTMIYHVMITYALRTMFQDMHVPHGARILIGVMWRMGGCDGCD